MKKKMIAAAAAAVLVLAAVMTACGGKDTKESQTAAETETEETTAEEESQREEESQTEEAKEELTVTGEIVAAGMSSITIRTEDGSEESYLKEDTKVEMKGDQVEGTMVTITYEERDGMNYALLITDAQ